MRSAELLGRNHHELGAIAAIAEGHAAITICRGGAEKTYSYTDPNEDAACFATGPGGSLVAVADGHHGARGAERVVRWLLEERAPAWTAEVALAANTEQWRALARELIEDAHAQILSHAHSLRVAPAPSTLTVVLVRPDEDLLVHASIGDSHAFVIGELEGPPRDLGWASTGRRRSFFLGEPFDAGRPAADQLIASCIPLADVVAVVLASDGLSEQAIGVPDAAATVGDCVARAALARPALRPLEVCRNVTEAALDAHRTNRSGDNIAAAVLWLDRGDRRGA